MAIKELTKICWKKRRKKRQKYSVTAVLVPHCCPNSLISGRKWDSTYQMRFLLQFFNLCFESCLILNQMKRLDVIFLLTKCIVIYNHNNTPGISLRIVYYFSASSHILHTPHILHMLQMTTKNFVQMLCSTFFALREICSTFFCRSWTLFNYFCPSWTLFNFFLPWTLFNWLNFLHWHFSPAYIYVFSAMQHLSIENRSMISFQRNIIIVITNWHLCIQNVILFHSFEFLQFSQYFAEVIPHA